MSFLADYQSLDVLIGLLRIMASQATRKRKRTASAAAAPTDNDTASVIEQTRPISKIDPDGDVLLCVGEDTRLLVSSKVLSVASKPFKTMFSPRFMEGQALSTMNPPHVDFPDDDARAMEDLCRILHSWASCFPKSPSHALELLCTADKYAALSAVQDSLSHYVLIVKDCWRAGDPTQSALARDLAALLIIAYTTKLNVIYQKITKRLLLETAPSFSFTALMSSRGAHLLPVEIWSKAMSPQIEVLARLMISSVPKARKGVRLEIG